MGLFGALIVRPSLGANYVYNRADSQFTPTEEFLALLSEIDPYQHQAWEIGAGPGTEFQYQQLPRALLDDQWARLPGQHRR